MESIVFIYKKKIMKVFKLMRIEKHILILKNLCRGKERYRFSPTKSCFMVNVVFKLQAL